MTRTEVLEFINANPVCFLATTRDNKPFVRAMMTAKTNETGIFFSTDVKKDVYKQLTENPLVEICYCNSGSNAQIRISGSVEIIDDKSIKEEIVEKFPFLKPWIEKEGYEAMATFCLSEGKTTGWTMDNKQEEKTYTDF